MDRKIKRSDTVFISSSIREKDKKQYCPICEKYKVKRLLHDRVYTELEIKENFGQLPADHDIWLQCYACGNIFERDDVKKERRLSTSIEIPRHPPFGGRETEHLPKPKHRRGFNERLQQEPEIKDKEVLKELKKGGKLLSYSSTD